MSDSKGIEDNQTAPTGEVAARPPDQLPLGWLYSESVVPQRQRIVNPSVVVNDPPLRPLENTASEGADIHSEQSLGTTVVAAPTVISVSARSTAMSQGRAFLSVTPVIDLRFAEMSKRIEATEKTLAEIAVLLKARQEGPPGIGHNNPPEAIEVPITPKRRRKIESRIGVIKKQRARPKREPKGALRAAKLLKSEGIRLAKWCKKQVQKFVGVSVATAAMTAGPLWGRDIHDGTVALVHQLSVCLIELAKAVVSWVGAFLQMLW